MSASKTRLNLVVAVCNNSGIGVNGNLPWTLRKDMAHFKSITSQTSNSDKQNAVIMGRRTWESIPKKFRPLANRLNVILSKGMSDAPEGACLAHSLDDAISIVTSQPLCEKVDGVYVIGGASVYKEALQSEYPCRIYYTRVMSDIDCDTFFPHMNPERFTKIESPENIEEGIFTEKGLSFQFEVYDKLIPSSS